MMTPLAYSQNDETKFYPFAVKIKKQFYKGVVSGKHYFKFIEERDDPTRMGFFLSDNKVFYFNFPEEATGYLTTKYNEENDRIEKDTILIGIRRIWVSQEKVSASLAKSILLKPVTTVGSCRTIFNIYKKINSAFFNVCQYDSTVSKNGYLGNTNDELIGKSLLSMISVADSVSSLNYSVDKLGEKVNINGLRNFPAIITDKTMKDGFYMSYEDFLKNKTSDIAFDFISTRKEEYIKILSGNENDSVYSNKCWGFCKNGVAYVRFEKDFSRLRRHENSFDLFLVKPVAVNYNKLANAFWTGFSIANTLSGPLPQLAVLDIPTKKTSNTIIWGGLYKLDIFTGEIY